MEKKSEGSVYTKLTTIFVNHPHATVTTLTLIAFVAIGVVIYRAPQFGNAQSTAPATNALKFNLPSESQNQGEVQGATTQANGPVEQQSSDAPPSTSISKT